jgi:serine phosphatase RsbU (regulator of sigma subunit)
MKEPALVIAIVFTSVPIIIFIVIYVFVVIPREMAEEQERKRIEAEKREKLRLVTEERKRIEAQERRLELERRKREAYEHNMQALSLTCRRCGKIAPPIPGTGNRYRCGGCGNQFAGAAHRM